MHIAQGEVIVYVEECEGYYPSFHYAIGNPGGYVHSYRGGGKCRRQTVTYKHIYGVRPATTTFPHFLSEVS